MVSLEIPKPPEVIKPSQPVTTNLLYVIRDTIIPAITTSDLLRHGLQLDGDVYNYTSEGCISKTPVLANRYKYLTNDSFKDAEEIDSYLRKWGKIPAFLNLKKTESKGYGIFTTVDIPLGSFLGYYEGIVRPLDKKFVHNKYLFNLLDFDSKPCSISDAENLTFSNWTRFINDGGPDSINIEFCVYNTQIYVFPKRDIKAGEELVGSYGDQYWQSLNIKKID